MVEPIMYLAIGFLVSMLFGLMIVPLVHNRAVRLTIRRLEAATPLSMAEIQADKDQLRAEFAVTARRLEMSIEQLKNKTSSQSAELGKKSDAVNRLKMELGEKNAAIFSLETREKTLRDQIHALEQDLAAKNAALDDRQDELASLASELSDARRQQRSTAESIGRELDEAHMRIAELSEQTQAQRAGLQSEGEAVTQQVTGATVDEGLTNAMLRERITDIAAQVAKLAATLEGPNSPIETILAAEPARPAISAIVKGAVKTPAADGPAPEVRGTLAQRIRALQAQASRTH